MKTLIRFTCVLIAASTFIIGCKKNDLKEENTVKQYIFSEVTDTQIINFFLNQGFDTKKVAIKENNEIYVVEGDISFKKVDVLKEIRNGQTSRHSYEALIGEKNIYVAVAANLAVYDNAIRDAIREWNSITDCKVNLIYIPHSPFSQINILLQAGTLGSGICGLGSFPSGGNAGSTITIDLNETQLLDHAQLVFLLIHEFGHNLGLRHSDIVNPPNNIIPGTPVSDPGSVMRSATCGFSWLGFTQSDVDAIRFMYPANNQPHNIYVTQVFGPHSAPAFSTVTHTSGAFYPCGTYEWQLLDYNEQFITGFITNCSELTWGGYPAGEYFLECRLVNPKSSSTTPYSRLYLTFD